MAQLLYGSIIIIIIQLLSSKIQNVLKKGGIIRTEQKNGPLSGIKVLDLSIVIAAPWAAVNMAELGAEIIKVECLTLIDSARGLGHSPAVGMAGCFASTGRGKQSIILNLKTNEGLNILKKLVKKVDVFIQNFRPGVVDKMGIGYEVLSDINPDIIQVSSSGYGQSGPQIKERIYDMVIQAKSGACETQKCSISGEPKISCAFIDKITALTTFQAVCSAIYARKNGHGGQHIKVDMLHSGLQFLWPDNYYNQIWPNNRIDEQKIRFIDLIPDIPEQIKKKKMPMKKAEQLLKDEDWVKKYLVYPNSKHLLFGELRGAKYPVTFSNYEIKPIPAPAMLGEHTNKILQDLGYNKQQISKFGKAVTSTESLLIMKKEIKKAKIFKYLGYAQKFSANTFKQDFFKYEHKPKIDDSNNGPLHGVNILEFSQLVAGPMTNMILSDQGANVIKIEIDDYLDPARYIGTNKDTSLASLFACLNRNKKSLIIKNLDDDELTELIRKNDVFVIDEALEIKYHLSQKLVKSINNKIKYVLIKKGRGEYESQAISGSLGTIYESDGNTTYLEGFYCEKTAAQYTSAAISISLCQDSGEEIIIDLEQSAVHFGFVDSFWTNVWLKSKLYKTFPQQNELIQPWILKDGTYVISGALTDSEFKGLFEIYKEQQPESDQEEIKNGKWDTLHKRIEDWPGFIVWWKKILLKLDYDTHLKLATKAEIFNGKVLSRDEVINDVQVIHKKIIKEITHPKLGSYNVITPVPDFSKTPCKIKFSALLPGENQNDD